MATEEISWSNIIFRAGTVTALHPVDYCKTLIQLGYEPIAAKPTRTFFGRPALGLPSVFQYIGYIRQQDGFLGLYRGLGPKICSTIIKGMAFQRANEAFAITFNSDTVSKKKQKVKTDSDEDQDSDDEAEDVEETASEYFFRVAQSLSATTVSVAVSQPFHVVTVRTMAQFIGGETKYVGIFGSAQEIYQESGILGFFKGLIPRIAGEVLAIVLASSVTYTVNTYIISDKRYKATFKTIAGFFSTSLTYPFHVVATCMTVTGSGLAAGQPPHMPVYVNWIDCWSHLSRNAQLKRGSSMLWRYYTGTTIVHRPFKIDQFKLPTSSE